MNYFFMGFNLVYLELVYIPHYSSFNHACNLSGKYFGFVLVNSVCSVHNGIADKDSIRMTKNFC